MIAANAALSQMFWPDIQAMHDEPIRLPVDAVISAIFRHLPVSAENSSSRLKKNFAQINNCLRYNVGCEDKDMLVWDDLWF